MATASFTVTIDRAPAEVLAYVADLRHAVDWYPTVDAVELISGHTPGEQGARFLLTAERLILDDIVIDYETTEVVPDTSITFTVKHPKLDAIDRYRVEPAGDGTTLTYETDITHRGLNKVNAPFGAVMAKAVANGLGDGLKQAIEREP